MIGGFTLASISALWEGVSTISIPTCLLADAGFWWTLYTTVILPCRLVVGIGLALTDFVSDVLVTREYFKWAYAPDPYVDFTQNGEYYRPYDRSIPYLAAGILAGSLLGSGFYLVINREMNESRVVEFLHGLLQPLMHCWHLVAQLWSRGSTVCTPDGVKPEERSKHMLLIMLELSFETVPQLALQLFVIIWYSGQVTKTQWVSILASLLDILLNAPAALTWANEELQGWRGIFAEMFGGLHMAAAAWLRVMVFLYLKIVGLAWVHWWVLLIFYLPVYLVSCAVIWAVRGLERMKLERPAKRLVDSMLYGVITFTLGPLYLFAMQSTQNVTNENRWFGAGYWCRVFTWLPAFFAQFAVDAGLLVVVYLAVKHPEWHGQTPCDPFTQRRPDSTFQPWQWCDLGRHPVIGEVGCCKLFSILAICFAAVYWLPLVPYFVVVRRCMRFP
ncbi:hypothetical protein WJX72_009254 [[Myrmecia] bisecta]|uniref:Uncharacterized protein n=1 Tax=[Myrmecia] bisecta TaxID=41462 RepID=A0AAW1PLY3_9CHLO